jgi:3-isopropylmalate dehydrogenase
MKANLVLLPGDGVGPEVVGAAAQVLERVTRDGGHQILTTTAKIGGCAIEASGTSLPRETLERCRDADAILLGAVGGPQWSDPSAPVRPEQGLLELRSELRLFANLRPVPVFPALAPLAPLRAELLENVDLLIVRELTGGLYFGPRQEQGDGDVAYDTMLYTTPEVERVAHVAFKAARQRSRRLASIDKANVLASMRLWRRAVVAVAAQYPDVEVEHVLVDAMAMHLMRQPGRFDVILAGNLFGDILSDEAAVLAGSLGMLPSASLGASSQGLYEPVHGSAPDIAGRGIANPIGAILSLAMLLRHSLGLEAEAGAIERAVSAALDSGLRTADLSSGSPATTAEMTRAIVQAL